MRLRKPLRYVRTTRILSSLLDEYVYSPLPTKASIRLLELVPSTDRSRVRFSLKTFELRNAPVFKALSYTWGHSETVIERDSTSIREATAHCIAHHRNIKHIKRNRSKNADIRTRRHHIVCDGLSIKVMGNLRDALRMLAKSTTTTLYWIDALCIDQKNVIERNAQVAQMADIFQRASGLVVWLGWEDNFTKDALTVIEKVSAIPESDWPLVPYTSFYDPGPVQHGPKPDLTHHNWLGFITLINRPWFRRAWVIQEIAFGSSPVVVCGTKVFSWDKLSRTLSFIKATKWYHHLHTEKMKRIREIQKYPGVYKRVLQSKLSVGISPLFLNETRVAVSTSASFKDSLEVQKLPFIMLLGKHRFSRSTDPRDKVYAFLGLADSNMAPFRTNPNALTPNYNLSVQRVYLETAKTLLTATRSLSLLSHVEDESTRRISGLPSWVPDYSVSIDPYPLPYRGPGLWRASGDSPWQLNATTMDSGLLDVQGSRVGYIDQTSFLSDESSDPSASWASTVKLVLSLELPYPNPSGRNNWQPSRVEILWRTLTTDTYAHTCPAPSEAGLLFIDYILNLQVRHRLMPWSSSEEFQPHCAPRSESIYPEWGTLLNLEQPGSPYSLNTYKQRLATVVESMFNGTYSPIGLAQLQHELDQSGGKKRRIFRTQCGYLGTGPRSLKPKDEIWVLRRGALPFVLRPLPNGNYRLIGEAFVYGIMHGEALVPGLRTQSITIE